jgi:excisionase family DNA binding protein
MGTRIYNVKQAAKILGLSTNTTYKYLNEGRIKAARGHTRGTFIITTKSLEDFLGTKLPDHLDQIIDKIPNPNSNDPEAVIEVAPPTLSTKVVRVLLGFCLVLIIINTLTTKNFSPFDLFAKVGLVFLFLLLSYQHGGFTKK